MRREPGAPNRSIFLNGFQYFKCFINPSRYSQALNQDAVGDAVDAAPPGPAHVPEEPERAVDVAAAHAGLQHRVHDDGVER
uniref:Uncharacterized protein n=1 Tax=Arundo donax TaxID=35708 RepID=A0A0A9CZQ0_ARUDO